MGTAIKHPVADRVYR